MSKGMLFVYSLLFAANYHQANSASRSLIGKGGGADMVIFVRPLSGPAIAVSVPLSGTVRDVIIASGLPSTASLSFGEVSLDSDALLADEGIGAETELIESSLPPFFEENDDFIIDGNSATLTADSGIICLAKKTEFGQESHTKLTFPNPTKVMVTVKKIGLV